MAKDEDTPIEDLASVIVAKICSSFNALMTLQAKLVENLRQNVLGKVPNQMDPFDQRVLPVTTRYF